MQEAGRFLPLTQSLVGVRYLQISIWAHGISGQEAILQQNLANIAELQAFAWEIPRPPNSFGLVTLFQPTRWIFFLLEADPQRKFLTSLSTSSHIRAGSLQHCVKYSGMGETAAFKRTSLPAGERHFDWTLSITN